MDLEKIKRNIAAIFILCFSIFSAQTKMYVHSLSGNVNQYPIDSIRKVTFPAGKLQIHGVIGDTVDHAYSGTRMVNFSNLTTDIKNNESKKIINNLSVVTEENFLIMNYVTHYKGNILIRIYDMNGRQIMSESVNSIGNNIPTSHRFPFIESPSGWYICVASTKINEQAVKFNHTQ